MATGLEEVLHEDYLRYRIESTAYLGRHLVEIGVPIVVPPGGHAIYIDAAAMLPHIPARMFPGQALVAELYLEVGSAPSKWGRRCSDQPMRRPAKRRPRRWNWFA